jgi:ribosomal protein S12 methylthiotransferase
MEFDRLGAFTYSPEEGTPAASFPDQIEEETKLTWRDEIMELSSEILFERNEALYGREMITLIEGEVSGENVYIGRTYRDAPDVDGYIFIHTDETLYTGDIVRAHVTGANEYDLVGTINITESETTL